MTAKTTKINETLPQDTGDLRSRAMLVRLTIHEWEAKATNERVSNEITDSHGAAREMGEFRQRKIAKERLARIHALGVRFREWLKAWSSPWAEYGDRIVPAELYLDKLAARDDYVRLWEEAVDEFVDDYDAAKEEAKELLNGLYNEDNYPSPDELRAKFGIEWKVRPLSAADDFRIDLGKVETDRIRKDIQAEQQALAATATRDAVERMVAVITTMATKLREFEPADKQTGTRAKNVYRDTLIGNVKEMGEVLSHMNFTDDPALNRVISQLDSLWVYDAEATRKNDAARTEIITAADDMLKQLQEFLG